VLEAAQCAAIELEVLRYDAGPDLARLGERWSAGELPDLIAVTSTRAARALAALAPLRPDEMPLLVAVGKTTAEPLRLAGLEVEYSPGSGAADMADWLLMLYPEPRSVLFLKGNLSLGTLPDALEEAGWTVEEMEVYRTLGVTVNPAPLVSAVERHRLAASVFASPSAVDSLRQNVDSSLWRALMRLPVLAQGGATAERLQHTGAEHVSLPAAPDPESVAEALALILKGPATT
jgi:uroporphyrinogen-III synthase